MKENEIIRKIREAFPSSGLGDDAAILDVSKRPLYLSSDAVVEGVHFKRRFSTLRQVMEKLVSANVSDMNAMNAEALGFLVTAGLPRGLRTDELEEILEGLKSAASFYGIRLLGGDTVLSPGGFFFDVSIVGVPVDVHSSGNGVFLRSGAQRGDKIVIFDECGRSAAGLALLEYLFDSKQVPWLSAEAADLLGTKGRLLKRAAHDLSLATGTADYGVEGIDGSDLLVSALSCIKAHLVPQARPVPGEFMERAAGSVHAAMDISDGISIDLSRMCRESNAGAVIFEERLPVPRELAVLADFEGVELTDLLLSSGEEYSILAAVGKDAVGYLPDGAAVIGEIRDIKEGLKLIRENRKEKPLDLKGFEHTF